nr:formylglycine-generating enzyme family protein [Acanthopleuribacter pedis]
MRWILPGTFWMGESEETAEYDDEKPRHQVWITRPFWLAETACSQALWQAVMGDNPSSNQQPDHPVERVSHVDVGKFHARLSGLWSGADFGLPSEVQWEYACRAGTTTAFSFGNTASSEQANFNGNYPYGGTPKGVYRKQTVPVQGFDANDWGLFQMHGNVWEWCRDGQRTYHGHGVVDPLGPLREGVRRVVRGGSFDDNARSCRSAYRNALAPGLTWLLQGFRLAGSSWYLEEATERPQQASRSAGERISGTDIHPSARHHKESR